MRLRVFLPCGRASGFATLPLASDGLGQPSDVGESGVVEMYRGVGRCMGAGRLCERRTR